MPSFTTNYGLAIFRHSSLYLMITLSKLLHLTREVSVESKFDRENWRRKYFVTLIFYHKNRLRKFGALRKKKPNNLIVEQIRFSIALIDGQWKMDICILQKIATIRKFASNCYHKLITPCIRKIIIFHISYSFETMISRLSVTLSNIFFLLLFI